MLSMTGYGKGEYAEGGLELTCEIKTVNNRYLDVSIKAPRIFAAYEDVIRNTIRKKLTRGHADVYISFKDKRERPTSLAVDIPLASSYVAAAKALNEKCLRNSNCCFGGYFHFLLLKFGYLNKTNNPNASPSKRMFGLFSCGRSDRVRTCGLMVPNHPRYQLRHTPIYLVYLFEPYGFGLAAARSPRGSDNRSGCHSLPLGRSLRSLPAA